MACATCEVISVMYRNMHTNSDEVMWGVLVSCPDPQERTEGLGNGAAARACPESWNSNDVKAANDAIRMDK